MLPAAGVPSLSNEVISKETDTSMEPTTPSNEHVEPGISIRYGVIEPGDIEMKDAGATENGAGPSKRKSRAGAGNRKSYAEMESSEEDDKPLVRHIPPLRRTHPLPH